MGNTKSSSRDVKLLKTVSYVSNTEKLKDYSVLRTSRTVISNRSAFLPRTLVRADLQAEFDRMKMTYREDRVPLPLRSELKRKHEQIRDLRDRGMSNVSHPSPRLAVANKSGRDPTSNRRSKTFKPKFSPNKTSNPHYSINSFSSFSRT